MSLEQAITDHASALRELAAAIRSTISGAHEIGATTDRVISEAKKTASAPAADKKTEAKAETKKPAATPAAETTAETETATASPSDGPAPTYDTVKAKVLALAQAKGRDVLVDLLSRHGVTKAPDLKEAQYAKFLADIDAINAGTYDPAAAELA